MLLLLGTLRILADPEAHRPAERAMGGLTKLTWLSVVSTSQHLQQLRRLLPQYRCQLDKIASIITAERSNLRAFADWDTVLAVD